MKQKIMHNLSLKMLSLLAALVVWLIIINIEDPTISKNITGIPVEVINENSISEAGKCYVLDDTDSVDIRVRGPKSVIDKVKESDFKAVADLSKYSITNAVPVEVKFDSTREFSVQPEIIYGESNSINILLDDFVTQSFEVDTVIKGVVNDGYYISKDEIVLNDKKVKISGPESLIDEVNKVSVTIDVSDIKEETTVMASIKAYDAYGAKIESDRMIYNRDTVNVTVKPLIKKDIPIKVAVKGKAKKGYKENNIKSSVESISIAGNQDSVKAIGVITLEVNISNKNKNIKKKFDLTKYISSTVKLISSQDEAEVTIDFEKLVTKTINFKSSDIKFINIRQGLLNKFDKDKKLSIKIRGLEKDVKNVTYTELVPYIDLGKLEVGKHKVKVKLENTSNIDIVEDAVLEVIIEDSSKVTESNGDTAIKNADE